MSSSQNLQKLVTETLNSGASDVIFDFAFA